MTVAEPQHVLQLLTVKNQVVERIKFGIFAGEWMPGGRIVELTVARRLGIGQTSVREALFELERQGFVLRIPNKGTYVKQFTTHQAEQVYAVRLAIEGLAVELLLNRGAEVDWDDLRKIAGEMSAAAEEGNMREFYRLDLEYHRTIWRLSGNPYIAETLEPLVSPLFVFYVNRLQRTREQLREEARSHQSALATIQVLDPRAARSYYERAIAPFFKPETGTTGARE